LIDDQTFDNLGQLLSEVRLLNIKLEKSITNEYLEGLYKTIDPFLSGYNIMGAGSGGFLFLDF